MSSVKIVSTPEPYRQEIKIREQFSLVADEPQDLGGGDAGATPTELVMAGLGSCKAITLKMYAERKGWELENVEVEITYQIVERQYHISVRLQVAGNLSVEQKQRLREIADKCPVHKLLQSSTNIETVLTD